MFHIAYKSKELKYAAMTSFAFETQAEAYAKVIELDEQFPDYVHWTVWM